VLASARYTVHTGAKTFVDLSVSVGKEAVFVPYSIRYNDVINMNERVEHFSLMNSHSLFRSEAAPDEDGMCESHDFTPEGFLDILLAAVKTLKSGTYFRTLA
jgi:hypothetical protein